MPSHETFSLNEDIILYSHHALDFICIKIPTFWFNNKLTSLLGKTNKGKKTPREDHELGYSNFTLALILYLPNPEKNTCNFPQCINVYKIG